jgi:hypothetical protein
MVFDISVAMTWVLFIALFPISFFWLRRAWRIIIKRDLSDVALKRGKSPNNPNKYAPYTAAINLLGGATLVFVIVTVVLAIYPYATWSAIAGVTIWMKLIADFILSRQAHTFSGTNKTDQVRHND